MSEFLKRKSIYTFNRNSLKSSPILVIGSARGGTSMVAGVLSVFGYYMGEGARSPVFESNSLSAVILGKSETQAVTQVSELNANHSHWAWKRPEAIHHISKVLNRVKPAAVVFVFRDTLATAVRRSKVLKDADIDDLSFLREQLWMVNSEVFHMIDSLGEIKIPIALVSYDTALQEKSEFVNGFAEFLGLTLSQDVLATAESFIQANPIQYLNATRNAHFQGVVDEVSSTVVRGWAREINGLEVAQVEIFADGVSQIVLPANQARADLVLKGFGECAYIWKPSTPFSLGTEIRIRIVGDVLDLLNSPQIVNY